MSAFLGDVGSTCFSAAVSKSLRMLASPQALLVKVDGSQQFGRFAMAPSALLLVPDKAGEGAILGHQLLIRALLHNLALLNDCRA